MPAPPHSRATIAGLLLLTASTGIVDAASYLALDRVFTGNMTGNVLFLGFAAVGVDGIPFVNNLTALAGFVLGSIVSGRVVGRGHPERTLPRRSVVTLLVAMGLLVVLSVWWGVAGELTGAPQLVVTTLLAVVMGAQVSAVKPVGNSDVTTIVVTNTIANLARDSRLGGGAGQRWVQRLLAVLAMAAGAALGALALQAAGGWLALACSVVAVGAAVVLLSRGDRPRAVRST